MRILIGAGLALDLLLFGIGLSLDNGQPLSQTSLFVGLHVASLGGAAFGVAASLVFSGRRLTPLIALAGILGWRLAYFPIMVFSGHVASIGEWTLAATGLPILVYPIFLLAVGGIHAAAGVGASWVVAPPHPWVRLALLPAFLVAALVSFNQLSDLRLLPDTVVDIDQPIPPLRAEKGNPYLPALFGAGYLPNQRVVLLAAGLTYETIPPSPWATAVKAVLEGLFHEKPFGSSRDRVLEHYLAYHSAHGLIGCRSQADCPIEAP